MYLAGGLTLMCIMGTMRSRDERGASAVEMALLMVAVALVAMSAYGLKQAVGVVFHENIRQTGVTCQQDPTAPNCIP